MKYFPLIIVVLTSCIKKQEESPAPLTDWQVKYEIVSNRSGDQGFFGYSTGERMRYVGNSADLSTWPYFPWSMDTVFLRKDGRKVLALNIAKIVNPQVITDNGDSVVSRIWVNGKVAKEGYGMNADLRVRLP